MNHAKYQVIQTFQQLKAARHQAHVGYLQTLPCYTIYQRYRGNPPLDAAQLNQLHQQVSHAQAIYQAGVDEDWRRSCMKYPEILDYFFGLVDYGFPEDGDSAIREPRFGALKGPRKLKPSRESEDLGNGHRKRSRRRNSRGRTPPAAPMPGSYR